MPSGSLSLYEKLSRFSRPKTYAGKFLLTAFIGVHVPLIGILIYVALGTGRWAEALPILIAALTATLVGTAATLWLQLRLLAPVLRTSEALERYRLNRDLPDLPSGWSDEAGLLMANAESCVLHLDDLLEFRTDLLRMVSHDLKGLVGGISMATEIIQEEARAQSPDVAEIAEMTRVVSESAGRQQNLIRNIMAMARAEGGHLPVDRAPESLEALVARGLDSVRFAAESKGVELSGRGDPTTVEVDGAKADQIVQNLLFNAVKFTRRGGQVALEATAHDDRVVLVVSDTGVGMEEPVTEALFEAYSSAQRGGTSAEAGTGLGLWICRLLVDAQEGRIDVDSTPGEGSRFTVTLPVGNAVTPESVVAPW